MDWVFKRWSLQPFRTTVMWGQYISKSVYCILSLNQAKFHVNCIVTLLHLLLICLNLCNQKSKHCVWSLLLCVLCIGSWGQSWSAQRIQTKLEHQTSTCFTWINGDWEARARWQGLSLLGDPVATKPESLFYFLCPSKISNGNIGTSGTVA